MTQLSLTAFEPASVPEVLKLIAVGSNSDLQPARLIAIDIGAQLLHLIIDGNPRASFPVSTSRYGVGCRQNTGCTPLGWHKVADKIGSGELVGTMFKGRRVTGVADDLRSDSDDDRITSRILWLAGLQPGFNQGGQVDSRNRYIYIHGTAQEQLLGVAASEGCIRMANKDVIELFQHVDADTLVFVGLSL